MSKLAKALTAAAGNAGESLYVEDVFSTYLYEGNGSTQTITNGIDLDGEGGLVWIKNRGVSAGWGLHFLFDTERSPTNSDNMYYLQSSSTSAQSGTNTDTTKDFGGWASDGFLLGSPFSLGADAVNGSGSNYASWTFRKAPKFFDVVTYTGDGSVQSVNHNLGSVPTCMIVKRTDSTGDWYVYHVDLGAGINGRKTLKLNSTAAQSDSGGFSDHPTDTAFTVNYAANTSGGTYVAYLFASDAGGFGDDGSESIIKCGSYTGDGVSGNEITGLGWEPQWLMVKRAGSGGVGGWFMVDTMRGIVTSGAEPYLYADTSGAELGPSAVFDVTPDGFIVTETAAALNASGVEYIYIAIRRPMKTPESGTEVFAGSAITTTGSNLDVTNNINMASGSLVVSHRRDSTSNTQWFDNLRGPNKRLRSNSTDAEDTLTTSLVSWNMDGFTAGTQYGSGESQIFWSFKRATGFFDVVAYTGDGTAGRTVAHNLGVAPELIIVKRRNASSNWRTYNAPDGNTKYMNLQDIDGAIVDSTNWNNTTPTSSVFTVGTNSNVNASGGTFVSYLFATLAGVSKVGSYTGNGTSQTIDCGFSGGARFILIKSTSTTGSWWVYDSARGIVAGNDPALQLNSPAAEVTSADAIDPDSSGFIVNQEATCSINASGVSYIFMSIA